MTTTTAQPPAIYGAMGAVMADVGSIAKGRRNAQQGFVFRGIDDVMNALHGPLTRHGVLVVPEVLERLAETRPTGGGKSMNVAHLHVRFTFYATDGSQVTASAWGEAQDSGDKATGKAHSMAMKTAFLEVFCVPTEDLEDADATSQEAAPEQRGPVTREAQAEATATRNGQASSVPSHFYDAAGVPTIDAIEQAQGLDAWRALVSDPRAGKPFKILVKQVAARKEFAGLWGTLWNTDNDDLWARVLIETKRALAEQPAGA